MNCLVCINKYDMRMPSSYYCEDKARKCIPLTKREDMSTELTLSPGTMWVPVQVNKL